MKKLLLLSFLSIFLCMGCGKMERQNTQKNENTYDVYQKQYGAIFSLDESVLRGEIFSAVKVREEGIEPFNFLMQRLEKISSEKLFYDFAKNGYWSLTIPDMDTEKKAKNVFYASLTVDHLGKADLHMEFQVDTRGNLLSCESTFSDGDSRVAEDKGTDPFSNVCRFAKEFLDLELRKIEFITVPDLQGRQRELYDFATGAGSQDYQGKLWETELPKDSSFDKKDCLCFQDSFQNYYVVNRKNGMIMEFWRIPGAYRLTDRKMEGYAKLYFADEKRILFGGSFGLYSFDRENCTITAVLYWEDIGVACEEGDEVEKVCNIQVSGDGKAMYLQPVEQNQIYRFQTETGVIEEIKDEIRKKADIYDGIVHEDGERDQAIYTDETGKEHSLELTYGGGSCLLGELGYLVDYPNGEQREWVASQRNFFTPAAYQQASMAEISDMKDVIKIEMLINGQMIPAKTKKALKWLKRQMKNTTPYREPGGASYCNPMYLTMKDGTIKVIYPAVDGDDTIWGGEGLWDLNRSLETLDMSDFWEAFGVDGEAVQYP